MTQEKRPIAVLTGDLIGSTELAPYQIDAAFRALTHEVVKTLENWPGHTLRPAFARSRGDGWQLRIDTPRTALRVALLARAALRGEDAALTTRIAIATGEDAADLPHNLNEATGAVFIASGRTLDAMPKGVTLAHAHGGPLAAATRLADYISADWTPAQAVAMQYALAPNAPTRAEIGAALGKSRQAVDQALAAAGHKALSDALNLIEA